MRLKDKVALITGGGGDIAVATARKFLDNGASVILFDVDGSLLKKVEQDLSAGSALKTVAGDVRKLDDLQRAVETGERCYGKIDILVTCAGVLKHMPINELSQDNWDRVIGINLTGTYLACKAVLPKMKERKYGRIVTIASVGGRTGRPNVGVDYAASKGGVLSLTMSLAREIGSFGITINCIAPGPLGGRMTNQMPPEHLALLISNACVGRLGKPEDIANAATYLASDEAEWVTGEILDVNGGVYI